MSSSHPSSDRIIAFEAVMRYGSLSAAARQLGLSQPTVRRAIEALETQIGLKLFTRSENGLHPTDRAHALLPLAHSLTELTHAFTRMAAAGDSSGVVEGTVRVTASKVAAHYLLPGAVNAIRQVHPLLRFQVVAEDQTGNLLRREADLAVRMTEPKQAQLVVQKVKPLELGLFAAPSCPLGAEETAGVSALLRKTAFVWEDRSRFLTNAAKERGLSPPANIAVAADDQALQVAMIAAGTGVGLCQVGIANALGLKRLAPDWSSSVPVWIAAHEDQLPAPHIRAGFDGLTRYFNSL